MFQRFRNTIARFMVGRYGSDPFNRFLCGLYFVLWFVALFFVGVMALVVRFLYTAVLAVLLWRTLSRDIPRRQAENAWFLGWWHPFKRWCAHQVTRLRDIRHFRYRRCPGCRSMLRLPIKRGKRTVTCHRCHAQFQAFFL